MWLRGREGTLLDRDMSMCKGPEAGACLACSRKGKKANVAGVKWAREQVDYMMSERWLGARCVGPGSPLSGLWHLL